jgi:DNA-binding NarL/FixJ family response regulator
MKILLVTFDKEMDKKIRELLKDYQIVTVKNGEEALLLNMGEDIGLIIYDALAGGIAEEDINKLYEEGFKDVPYIILMDDLFPIDPNNIKPKNKRIISREVEVDKLPEIVKELLSKAPAKKEETGVEWEQMFGTPTVEPQKEEKKEEAPVEEKPAEAAPAIEHTAPPTEEAKTEEKKEVSKPAEEVLSKESAPAVELPTKKQCLLVSFDMPLVEKVEEKIKDLCDIYVARSSKQALQKYRDKDFDVIIFDTISGVFAEKGIRDLYEKGGFKDALYVVLLDEFMPIDIDKLPVKNMRAIKRESELDLLPEIVENAPHITLEKALEKASAQPPAEEKTESAPAVVEEKPEEAVAKLEELLKETPVEKKEEKPAAKEQKTEEKPAPQPTAKPAAPAPQSAPAQPAPQPAQPVAVSEELIERIVEQKVKQMVLPVIDELIKTKLNDIYIRGIVEEYLREHISDAEIREIVQEIAEPLVREVLEQLLS